MLFLYTLTIAAILTVASTSPLETTETKRDDYAFFAYATPGCPHGDTTNFDTAQVGNGCFDFFGVTKFHAIKFVKPGQFFTGGGCKTPYNGRPATGQCLGFPGNPPITGVKMG